MNRYKQNVSLCVQERKINYNVTREKFRRTLCFQLKSTEFLNLDSILESVMHKLVVRPLKAHLYKLFVDEYTKSGAIQVLHENILYARTKPLTDLGIRVSILIEYCGKF